MRILIAILAVLALAETRAATVLSGSVKELGAADKESWSKELREGVKLILDGFFEQGVEKVEAAAEKEEPPALYLLGSLLRDGRGLPRDIKRAKLCFEKAAAGNDPLARQELELLRFVDPKDPDEFAVARKRLELFALDGMSRSQLQLGLAHLEGYGFPADAKKGVGYLADAAKSSGPAKAEAAFRLGLLYRDGRAKPEVKKDAKAAEAWLKYAADTEHVGAVRTLGEFYLSSVQGKQDFARARGAVRRLERLGDAAGLYYLGRMSEMGWGVDKDTKAAREYYRKAAEKNIPLGLFKMAEFYEHGLGGLEKDERKATAFYRKGAEAGHPVCMYNLSVMLDKMDEHPPLKAEVIPWLLRAAAGGLSEAEFQLGFRYQKGRGVQQDFVAAAAWFDRAARSGHALAQLHLGEMYENAHGVKRDYSSARRLFELSARGGNNGGRVKYAIALANGVGGERDLVSAYLFASEAVRVAPKAELAVQIRDAVKKAMSPEQLAEAEKKLKEGSEPAGDAS